MLSTVAAAWNAIAQALMLAHIVLAEAAMIQRLTTLLQVNIKKSYAMTMPVMWKPFERLAMAMRLFLAPSP